MLAARKGLPADTAEGAQQSGGLGGLLGEIGSVLGGGQPAKGGRQRMSVTEQVIRAAAQSFARSASTQIAREAGKILRNTLGGMSK